METLTHSFQKLSSDRLVSGTDVHKHRVPDKGCASCYGQSSVQPLQLFGHRNSFDYMSLFTYRGPRCAPRPRLACNDPRMTLRQICRMLKTMKQHRAREAAMVTSSRKQGSAVVSSPVLPEKRCLPFCLRRRRNNIKRAS
ncbi:unnamed protein product [Merluccius merluccius]